MKKFVRHILIFIALFASIFTGLNIYQASRPYEPSHFHTKYAELFNKNDETQEISGIIIGNSTVAYSIRPSILDQTGVGYYNFGYGRADIDFFINWLDYVFPKYKQPIAHCIIAVDRGFFKQNQRRLLEQDAEYFPSDALRSLMLNSDLNGTSLFLNQFPAFKYRKKLLTTLFEKKGPVYFGLDQYGRGFIPFNRPYNATIFNKGQKKNLELSKEIQASFEKLLTRLQDAGIKVKMVMPPEYNFDSNKNSKLLTYLDQISERLEVPFYNFNGEYADPAFQETAYFSDLIHVNESGSNIFSALLAEAINSAHKAAEIEK